MAGTVFHTLTPIADENSRILILGTMPSPKSREIGFYYGHPQNRFWRILAALYDEALPTDNTSREALLRRHGIALWDVLRSCRIEGASDASIRDPLSNDIAGLLHQYPGIGRIYTTGATAGRLYRQLCQPTTGVEACILPSPSAANARMSLAELIDAYHGLLDR